MICTNCRKAGALNARQASDPEIIKLPIADILRTIAGLHCRRGDTDQRTWCDCQCKIGTWIRSEPNADDEVVELASVGERAGEGGSQDDDSEASAAA